MKRLIFLFVVAALAFGGVAAQAPLLPDQAASWVAEGPATTNKFQDLAANGTDAANVRRVLQESGLSHIEQRDYRNGEDSATLRVFTLRDPSSAYEFYTFLLTPAMRTTGLGENSAVSDIDTRLLVGNLVVQATLSSKAKPESLSDFVAVLKSKADGTPLPPLKNYLPEHWRVFGSEKYALGPEAFRAGLSSLHEDAYTVLTNEAGFQNGAEAMMARYQGEHGSGILVLLEYPTPQLAENHLHHLEQAMPAGAKQSGVTVERKASLLSIVLAATAPMHAQAIRDEVNYETRVTWNEPSQTATDPPLVYMMFKIFLFTCIFLVVATVVGIFFGGLRILVKHWLPGKVFDRPQDIEVLQLGLSGKKIDPTDMY